jgi:hypothetical protein
MTTSRHGDTPTRHFVEFKRPSQNPKKLKMQPDAVHKAFLALSDGANRDRQRKCIEWAAGILDEELPDDFIQAFRSGVVLCR